MNLNIGCGEFYTPNWINIDKYTGIHADIYADLCQLPFVDNSVEHLYAGHVIEHLTIEQVDIAAAEIARVLRELRVGALVFPDMDQFPESHPGYEGALYGARRWPGDEHQFGATHEKIAFLIGHHLASVRRPVTRLKQSGWPVVSLAKGQGGLLVWSNYTQVVVPYAGKVPRRLDLPFPVTFMEMAGEEGYFNYFVEHWQNPSYTLINVEHDIRPSQAALYDLADCPEPWCAQPYAYFGGGNIHYGLGCAKITGAFRAETADLWDIVATMCDGSHPPKHWCRLDAWMMQVLHEKGYHVHKHDIMVKHTNTVVTHGCC